MMVMVLMGLLFISSIQPMFMVSSLILIMILYSYMIYNFMGGYWFSYALMMVMLSGVLVVFTYMVSLIPNESFESYMLMYIMGIMLFIVNLFKIGEYMSGYSIISLNLWSEYFCFFNIFMVSFLLGIMLIVVWLGYLNWGAIRSY